MIVELKNKISQNSSYTRSEDVLTGTVFGNLRYFSNHKLLENFLNQSTDLSNEPLALSLNENYDLYFWERYRTLDSGKLNEPDLVLLDNENVVIIECKYFSSLEEKDDNNKDKYDNQLLRYSKIIEEYYSSKIKKILIFLTNDPTMPKDLLEKTMEKLKKWDPEINLYWLSWSKLYKCMKHFDNQLLKKHEQLLFDDLLNFMEKRNLTEFCGFKIDDILFFRFYHKTYCFTKISSQNNMYRYKK